MVTKQGTVPTLEQVAQAEAFGGFTDEEFAVFEVEGFEARMSLLRARVRPKLQSMGEALTPRFCEAYEATLYPHIAQHLRRTVNAPVETWAAFAHERRAYKPYTHLRVALSRETVRVLVFVEDYADEKARFAAGLARNAEPLAGYLAHHATIQAYDIPDADGMPKRGSALDAETLEAFGTRMQRIKGQHARFGIAFDRSHPVVRSGPEFLEAAVEAARVLKPLYDCGNIPDFVYTYAPEPVAGI